VPPPAMPRLARNPCKTNKVCDPPSKFMVLPRAPRELYPRQPPSATARSNIRPGSVARPIRPPPLRAACPPRRAYTLAGTPRYRSSLHRPPRAAVAGENSAEPASHPRLPPARHTQVVSDRRQLCFHAAGPSCDTVPRWAAHAARSSPRSRRRRGRPASRTFDAHTPEHGCTPRRRKSACCPERRVFPLDEHPAAATPKFHAGRWRHETLASKADPGANKQADPLYREGSRNRPRARRDGITTGH
jgi:hypothetical protein